MKVLSLGRDSAGNSTFARVPSDTVNAVVLGTASTAESDTVPTGAAYVIFSATNDFYAKYGASPTAAVPSTEVTDGSGSVLNPTIWAVAAGQKISLVSAIAGTIVTLEYYADKQS